MQHLAARAVGVDERIATVTSMRADVPGLYDSSYLTSVRPVSDRPTLYREWLQYRIAKMRQELCSLESSLNSSSPVNITSARDALDAQIAYLHRTANQLVAYELHDRIIRDYGQDAYYAADDCWGRIQKDSDFSELLQAGDDVDFYPGSHLWADLYASRVAIAKKETLHGQLGNIRWDKEREYVMGDELLRQGLREAFFEWLGIIGLDRILELEHARY